MERRSFIAGTVAAAAVAFSSPSFAAAKIFTGLVPGVGIGGYDAVAYFTMEKAVVGDPAFTTVYEDAQWRFSSQANLDAFEADPAKYAPQFGGYCAYAASKGALAKGDPEAWTVHEGKLYLNFSKSVRTLWLKDVPGNIEKANGHFPNLLATWPDVTE